MSAAVRFVGLCWFIFVVFWAVSALSTKPAKEREPLASRLAVVVVIGFSLLFLSGTLGRVRFEKRVLPEAPGLVVVGDLFVLAGLLIALWARVVLGGNWSGRVTFKEGHELIQRGPYRVVRHPIYSGLLLMVLGTAVVLNRAGPFLAFGVYLAVLWVKLRQEEKLMTRHFPEAYKQYKARTKALIPFIL